MVKENCHHQIVDVQFGTWNVSADEINSLCNNVHKVDMLCENADVDGFIFHSNLSK